MNINIFGAGRSGTTALLLYLGYYLCKTRDDVWVNNEPLRWQSRRGPLSFEGQELLFREGLVGDLDREISNDTQAYIGKFTDRAESTITKFVSGSGFAHQFNRIMKPNATIVVIRDLSSVLKSISGSNWDYFSLISPHFGNIDSWPYFKSIEANQNYLQSLEIDLDEIRTRQQMNGLYWYMVNLNLLKFEISSTHFISFEKIEEQAMNIAQHLFPEIASEVQTINQTMFYDRNLSGEFPLVNPMKSPIKKLLNLANECVFQCNIRKSTQLPYIPFDIGSYSTISKRVEQLKETKTTNKNAAETDISNDPLLNKFQIHIDSLLEAKLNMK